MASREMMYREALREALDEEMARNSDVFIIGEGIAERGGSYKVTEGLLAKYGERRVRDTPISEASMIGVGVGAAISGARPIVEILYVDFAMLGMDQIVNQAAKFRLMTGGSGNVPFVLRTQGGAGGGVAAQHSQSLEALFYHIPGLRVVMPSTPRDAKGLLKHALRQPNPVMFIEHKHLYMTKGDVPEEEYEIEFGQADVKREGADVTLVAWSNMIPRSLEVAEEMAKEGISVEVIDPRTLVPLDENTIIESVKKTNRVVIVQEAVRRGGVASDICSIIQDKVFYYLDAPIEIVAGLNTPIPFNLELEKASIPQKEQIREGILKVVHSTVQSEAG
ncbi:Pyruvate dehydrogenase E1 component subunit beta [Vibrio nigripulchritudo MADA3029]|uniref:2-oxoisovalerate dehydrogenase subunit beta n=1 Tax=Vibrio nigripulchritudo SOn1 TaxID=1238450 RepID=A0AAV2VRF6_9VIBR|nr:Pyruvate dehydrogenase E1 component subunit beta [Vibrio nigripulchritudo MADA3020]CCN55377.1 Pyruvate dehydrogenase E1 component subunit beta [Vibrio nigripulchritudo MADA3021]CCN57238.1 Pyruvate dehydrogenase E1 component subunit beta [Vibrio nigripulchritudo MADA3029]CCN73419.1 Pyruvate dehydrogenase E1 component subunit beta [Vibrio nigripulchritudo SFn118]CCO47269.1 Pyruvate dehydrogenase E1 component subunit beta [Vibrio nigripulchritudo SOn1]